MSMHVKNGTPLHGPSLCETCSYAHIEKGYRVSEEAIFCRVNYPMHRVRFSVHECTGYVDKNRHDLSAMERIAWVLEPRGAKRVAGFVREGSPAKEDEEIELILKDEEEIR
jgi:hypothetical protein